VTAGADSAIKVQLLSMWKHEAQICVLGETPNVRSLPLSSSSNTEFFRISLVGPNVLGEGSSTAMDRYQRFLLFVVIISTGLRMNWWIYGRDSYIRIKSLS
jgi:hypothetical protein